MLIGIIFYDINADCYEPPLIAMHQDHEGEIMRVPSVGEVVVIDKPENIHDSKVKKYEVKEITTKIKGDRFRGAEDVWYNIGLKEIEEEKQEEESFDEFYGF